MTAHGPAPRLTRALLRRGGRRRRVASVALRLNLGEAACSRDSVRRCADRRRAGPARRCASAAGCCVCAARSAARWASCRALPGARGSSALVGGRAVAGAASSVAPARPRPSSAQSLDDGAAQRQAEAHGLLRRRPSDRSRRSPAPGRSRRRRPAARCPPRSGTSPRDVSLIAKRASSATTRRSQASASWKPAPTAWPCTAAMLTTSARRATRRTPAGSRRSVASSGGVVQRGEPDQSRLAVDAPGVNIAPVDAGGERRALAAQHDDPDVGRQRAAPTAASAPPGRGVCALRVLRSRSSVTVTTGLARPDPSSSTPDRPRCEEPRRRRGGRWSSGRSSCRAWRRRGRAGSCRDSPRIRCTKPYDRPVSRRARGCWRRRRTSCRSPASLSRSPPVTRRPS